VIRIGVVGLGKMGLSHYALVNAHPDVEVAAICDSTKYVLSVLAKQTGVATFSDYHSMLDEAELDAVVIATPSSTHFSMVETALERGLHVFCEKPLTLEPGDSERLADLARDRRLVTQAGYHNRFVATFREVKSLIDAGAIGEVNQILGEAYGPVVLKPEGRTWRSKRGEGGGCLYDYAAHVINLVNWYFGEPSAVGGTALPSIFSDETDDAAFSTLYFPGSRVGQISVHWSDESYRKMTTRITVRGSAGRIFADRQECQVYIRDDAEPPPGYTHGWNVRFTTDLTPPVWFYLRGEEYSEQVDAFVHRVQSGETGGVGDFESAAQTDRTIGMLVADARKEPATSAPESGNGGAPRARRGPFWRRSAA
jgi:predicted dehydrogenase